jgi:metallo-beta-lactamase class B
MAQIRVLLFFLTVLLSMSSLAQAPDQVTEKEIYRSENLIITPISAHTFLHTSYQQTNDFGKVPCNGLMVQVGREVIVLDSPTNTESSAELIRWVHEVLGSKIVAVIPTHFHSDCLGGLQEFHDAAIPSYAHSKTIELAASNKVTIPQHGFFNSIRLPLGEEEVLLTFFGPGHTEDNVVAYFSGDQVLFGGCLIKEVDASKGFLGDARIEDWSETVRKVKNAYPNVKWVVPGHGEVGGVALLDYTIKLFLEK